MTDVANNHQPSAIVDRKRFRGDEESDLPTSSRQRLQQDQGPDAQAQDNGASGDFPSELEYDRNQQHARALQNSIINIDAICSQRVSEVQREHEAQKAPVYKERAAALEKIDGFWGTVLENSTFASEKDSQWLPFIESIWLEPTAEEGSFKLSVAIADNEFFDAIKFERTIVMDPSTNTTTVTCTPVSWKAGLNLTEIVDENGRPELESFLFLNWLITPGQYQGQDEMAETFRHEIWPNPIVYFDGGPEDMEVELEYTDGDGFEFQQEDGGTAQSDQWQYGIEGGDGFEDVEDAEDDMAALGVDDGGEEDDEGQQEEEEEEAEGEEEEEEEAEEDGQDEDAEPDDDEGDEGDAL